MKGYEIMRDSYVKLMNEGKISKEDAEPEIRIYDFLSTCSQDDLYRLVDSSAFNDIMKGYMNQAIKNAKLKREDERRILNELRYLFDEKTAKEIFSWTL
ncbi:MAG: hypothetical protein PHX08_06725 [Lachnospiraceae bacterium]|nr:hypothetical protein [Lachnospiraceae bacterium]